MQTMRRVRIRQKNAVHWPTPVRAQGATGTVIETDATIVYVRLDPESAIIAGEAVYQALEAELETIEAGK